MVYTCIFFFIVTCTLQHSSKHNFVAPIHYTNTWWHQFLLYTSSVCDLASITCVLLMIYWIRDTFCIKNHHFSIVVQKLIWSVPSTAFNFWIAWNYFFFQGITCTNLQHWPLFFNTYIYVQRKCISTSLKFFQLIICFILIDILLNMRR